MYLGLLGLALIFCWQNILDYMDGKTSHSITREYITLEDLPTICFCLSAGYDHGENFIASIRVYSPNQFQIIHKPVPLVKNKYVSSLTISGLKFRLSAFQKTRANGRCYKISPQWNGSLAFDSTQFGIDLILNSTSYQTQNVGSQRVNMFVTSEKNSYGLAKRKWFDGNLNPYLKVGNGNVIKIMKINEYRRLKDGCEDDSYYECLSRRMQTFDMGKIYIDTTFNKSLCANVNVCAPGITLPPINGYEMSPCTSLLLMRSHAWMCSYAAMTQLIKDQSDNCKKCCNIKDFQLEIDWSVNLLESEVYPYLWEKIKPSWVVRFEFDSPMTSLDSRMIKAFKTVHTEYLIFSRNSVIGTVGGTIGMFVGFSFLGASEWFIALVFPKVWETMKHVLRKCPQRESDVSQETA